MWRVSCFVAALVSAGWVVGCAHPERAADRQYEELRQAVTRIQAEQDGTNRRLGALEVAAVEQREQGKKAASEPAGAPKPPARVVELGSPAPEVIDDDDDPKRPVISVVGAGRTRARTNGVARIVESEPGAPPAGVSGPAVVTDDGAASSALDPEAKRAYESALALVRGKKYDRGLEAFAAFLVKWPDHPYADNATYWRGEAHFAQGDYAKAVEQFEAVATRSRTGNKIPDALLKLGICQEKLGAHEKAAAYFERLRREFPTSNAAKRIPARRTKTDAVTPKGPKESR